MGCAFQFFKINLWITIDTQLSIFAGEGRDGEHAGLRAAQAGAAGGCEAGSGRVGLDQGIGRPEPDGAETRV